jgi:hypothetical protein
MRMYVCVCMKQKIYHLQTLKSEVCMYVCVCVEYVFALDIYIFVCVCV